MMNRIAVLIPSRDRPEKLLKACRSVLATSNLADVLVYVDEDQRELYESGLTGAGFGPRVKALYAARIGPVAAANSLVDENPSYAAYGLITDDTTIKTETWGWDAWLLETLDFFPRRLAVVSPRHNLGEHVDMPFVSWEWIDCVGWYACPEFYHYCWPILTGLIGEMTAIVHAPEQSFAIHHEGLPHTNLASRDDDAKKFFEYVALKMPVHVEALRDAMKPEVVT
jgi:hypothetical protein